MSKNVLNSVRNYVSVKKFQFVLFLFLCGCADLVMNNPCDPSSKDYATGIALKIASNDRKSYCDFNTRNSDNTASLPCSPCRIFVTAIPYSGGLGGISGADNKCAIDSNKPSTGIYKAFLSDTIARRACTTANCSGGPSEHLDWVMQPNKSYVRSITAIAIGTTNSNALLITQTSAVALSSITTWLGFNANWTTEPMLHCSDWIDGTNSSTGTLNDQGTTPIIGAATNTCLNTHSLICVEQ